MHLKNRKSIWKDIDMIKNHIATSDCRSEVLGKMDRSSTSSMYRRLKQFEIEHSVDISHYKSYFSKKRKNATKQNRQYTTEELFVENSTVAQATIRARVRSEALIPYTCDKCKNDGIWLGQDLSLQLEHKNGISSDHRLKNLCWLCPNCHSQTLTYCGRNIVKSRNKKQGPNREKFLSNKREDANVRNQGLIDRILSSDIDFQKFGWVQKAASLIEIRSARMKRWMTRYMPKFYDTCFRVNRHEGKSKE